MLFSKSLITIVCCEAVGYKVRVTVGYPSDSLASCSRMF